MRKIFVKQELIPVDLNTQLRLRLFREKRRGLVNFISQLELRHEEKWKVVVRYDCFHGFFHRDFYSPSGRKRRTEKIAGFKLIKEALDTAHKDLIKNHEIYIRRFLGDKK